MAKRRIASVVCLRRGRASHVASGTVPGGGALDIPPESWSQTAQNRVAKILVQLGFERYRPWKKGTPRTPRYRRDLSHQ